MLRHFAVCAPASRQRVLALALLMAPIAIAHAAGPGTYEVTARLQHAGTVFAEPSLSVKAGVPAHVEVAGTDGYALALTIGETDQGALQVEARLDSTHGAMAPTLVVRPGQPASVSIGALQLDITVQEGHP